MRKTILATGLFIGFAAFAYSRTQAQEAPGGPLPDGTIITIGEPMIQCDTGDQIKAIAEAKLQSDSAMAAKMDEFHAIIDAHNEPSCMFGHLQAPVTLIHSTPLPNLGFGETEVKAWNIHIGARNSDWYALYLVPIAPKSGVNL